MRDSKEIKLIILGHIGVGGQKGYLFDSLGLCAALPASQYKDATKILIRENKRFSKKPIQLGFMDNGTGQLQSNTVYSIEGICPCISTLINGGTQQIKVLVNGSKSNSTNGQHDRSYV